VDFSSLQENYKEKIKLFVQHIHLPSFLKGLAVIFVFYFLLLLFTFFTASSTIEDLESHLASQTIIVKHSLVPVVPEDEKGIPGLALAPAPEKGLHEHTESGPLPIIREADKMTSFSFYKRPYEHLQKNTKPVVAIALTDFGLSSVASQSALSALPPEVSFVISPYADTPQNWVNAARENGHEVWLDLLIENKNEAFVDPGPAALLVRANLKNNQSSMRWALSRATGYAGVASFTDDSFYRAELLLKNLVSELFDRGLGYMELNSHSESKSRDFALSQGAPYIRANLWIEGGLGEYDSFETLETVLKSDGYALAIVQAFPNRIEQLAQWITDSKDKYTFIPASAIYDAPLYRSGYSGKGKTASQLSPRPLKDGDHFEPEHH